MQLDSILLIVAGTLTIISFWRFASHELESSDREPVKGAMPEARQTIKVAGPTEVVDNVTNWFPHPSGQLTISAENAKAQPYVLKINAQRRLVRIEFTFDVAKNPQLAQATLSETLEHVIDDSWESWTPKTRQGFNLRDIWGFDLQRPHDQLVAQHV